MEEIVSNRGKISIFSSGIKMIPYETSDGIAFVDSKYLAPLQDIEENMLELYERRTSEGELYFAAKTGLMLVGIIMPINAINKQFVSILQDLSRRCNAALNANGSKDLQMNFLDLEEQNNE